MTLGTVGAKTFGAHPVDPIHVRVAEIEKILRSKTDLAALQQELAEIVEGKAFKGSNRSAQFLRHIVDEAVAGHFDSLKERVIGIELFGRSSSYDTGEDAIVRVTASDVRKRLLQHYGRKGGSSVFRLTLPLGSYIPEITREASVQRTQALDPEPAVSELNLQPPPVTNPSPFFAPSPVPLPGMTYRYRTMSMGILLIVLSLGVLGFIWNSLAHVSRTPTPVPPWSAFFSSPHDIDLITSDPDIAEIQTMTGDQISISDYANQNYIPEPNSLTPEALRFARTFLRGDKAAIADTPIAVSIAELAQANSRKLNVRAARSIQLSDFKSDDNFIFLGSPRSNPWSSFFGDQLDFKLVFDQNSKQEIIQNLRPREHEQPFYVPTAKGRATGQSFAIIAYVQAPDQKGQVLLLAGANGEGTEAAGKLVTDMGQLSTTLQKCGISNFGPLQHFELLLHLNTMAGSPNNTSLIACHILPNTSSTTH